MTLENVSLTIPLGLYTFVKKTDRHILRDTWKSTLVTAAGAGVLITGAYGLVLLAMAFVSNVSYVSAFRQISLPIGVFLGMMVHREPRYLPRLVGLVVILAGLAFISLG